MSKKKSPPKKPTPKPSVSLRTEDVRALVAVVPKVDPRRVLGGIFIEKEFAAATDGRAALICRHEDGKYSGPEFIADTEALKRTSNEANGREVIQVRHDPKEEQGANWARPEDVHHFAPGVTTISAETDGDTSKARAIDGKYPDVRQVYPGLKREDPPWKPAFEFAVDVHRLGELLKAIAPLAARDGGVRSSKHGAVRFQVTDATSPVRIVSANPGKADQWIGLIMPVRITELIQDGEKE